MDHVVSGRSSGSSNFVRRIGCKFRYKVILQIRKSCIINVEYFLF